MAALEISVLGLVGFALVLNLAPDISRVALFQVGGVALVAG
jgi:hypothetical protein